MSAPITPTVRTAMRVAAAALEIASSHGPGDTIVLALNAAGLLQDPDATAELTRLRKERATLNDVLAGGDQERELLRARLSELEPYEQLHPQECANQLHRPWFADRAEGELACPWCRIAELEQTGPMVYRAEHHDIPLTGGTYSSVDAAGTHAETALRDLVPAAICAWRTSPDRQGVIELRDDRPGGGDGTGHTGFVVVTVPVGAQYEAGAGR